MDRYRGPLSRTVDHGANTFVKAKSVAFTDEGAQLSKELFEKLFALK